MPTLVRYRLLRPEALKAEGDPESVGYAFGARCRKLGWERADLASWLGVTTDQLAALAIERRGLTGCPEDGQHSDLAERYGADRLAAVLASRT
jgi:hypothetical protein